jgi:hypothetical protein
MEYVEVKFDDGRTIVGEVVEKDNDDDSIVTCQTQDGWTFTVSRWSED